MRFGLITAPIWRTASGLALIHKAVWLVVYANRPVPGTSCIGSAEPEPSRDSMGVADLLIGLTQTLPPFLCRCSILVVLFPGMCRLRLPAPDSLEHEGDSLAAANAGRGNPVATASPSKFVQER